MKTLVLFLMTLSGTAFATAPMTDTPAYDPTPFQQAVVDAWGTPNLMGINIGELAYTEITTSHDGGTPFLTVQSVKNVTRLFENRNNERFFTLMDSVRRLMSDGRWYSSTTETNYRIPPQNLVGVATGFSIIDDLYAICVPTAKWNVKCSNLNTWTESVRAPDHVVARPNCEGLKDCRIQKKVVSFDVEVTRRVSPGRSIIDTMTYVAKMSADVPYFSRLTDFCVSGFDVTDSGRQVPYTECQTIRDFSFGRR